MSRRTQKNVGLIGLGIIGARVADNLRRRGFHVFVWNRTPRPFPNFVGSPAELAELCDFVQIFVSDDEALLEMAQQMKPALTASHIVLAHSTVAPATMRTAAEMVQRRGAQLLDAPFTGSRIAAEKGELVYYVAGDEVALRRARPVLQASSKETIEIGEIGQATTVKLATNMVTAASVQGAAEALALVHSSGLSPEKLAAAMHGNASQSTTLAMKLSKMAVGDFEAHFSVKHMLKDVQIVSRLARSYGLQFGATEAALDGLLDEMRQGRGDDDYSSISRRYFPSGGPLKREEAPPAEPEDQQAILAGLSEDNGSESLSERVNGAEEAAPEVPFAEESARAPEILLPAAPSEPVVSNAIETHETHETQERHEAAESLTPQAAEPEAISEPAEAPAETLIAPDAAPAVAKPDVGEGEKSEERRSLFSRLFGRGPDY